MSSNATEIELLLLEALNSLITTLRNTTLTASSSSDSDDDENSLTTTANRLALSATIISIAAFVIALLQAVLQYAGANESARQKCNFAAIGLASLHVRKRWSLWSWRRKFYYPEITMSSFQILLHKRFEATKSQSKLVSWMKGIDRQGTDYCWRRSNEGSEFGRLVSDGNWTLYHKTLENNAVWERLRIYELPWNYWLIWKVFIFMNRPRKSYRTRATWAQLLDSFEFEDYEEVVNGTVDAECIPIAIDVPTQTVSFDFLGKISFLMGLTSVKINAEQKEFSAFGELGSITTENISGYGRVVRFQRNSGIRLCVGARLPGLWQFYNLDRVMGNITAPEVQFNFSAHSDFFRHGGVSYLSEQAHVADAISWALRSEKTESPSEDEFWPERLSWQREMGDKRMVWPSVLLAATVAQLPVLVTAFPSDALLRPFTQVFARLATVVKKREGQTYDLMTKFKFESLEGDLLKMLTSGVFFTINKGPPGASHGGSGWADYTMLLTRVDSDDSDDSDAGYTQDELLKEWNDLMSPVLNNDANRNASKNPIILPIANELLVDFDVVKWRQRLDHIQRRRYNQFMAWTKGGFLARPRAETLLWLQVYLLDREIQQLMKILRSTVHIKGETLLEPPRDLEIITTRIVHAVYRAWADMDRDSIQDPLVALDRKIAKELGVPLSRDDRSSYIRQLADLLKLRCVFLVAYLMVIPDSSDLVRYDQSGADIRLPMI